MPEPHTPRSSPLRKHVIVNGALENLAIVGDDQLTVGAHHGLGPGRREIDDGETPVSEADAPVGAIHSPMPSGPRAAIWSGVRASSAPSIGLAA